MCTLHNAMTFMALEAGVCLVTILQAYWPVSTAARQCFSTNITTTDWDQDLVHCAVMGFSK